MDNWDPILLERLASNHTVIIFNNRGIGNTTSSGEDRFFSIAQFANDTAGLLDVLEIKQADTGIFYGWFYSSRIGTYPS